MTDSTAPQFVTAAETAPAEAAEARTPTLLVSVREADELRQAVALGVPIIDLKEPHRGALAPADPQLWELAAQHFCGKEPHFCEKESRALWSAALGEGDEATEAAKLLPGGFHFAKAGPRGCRSVTELHQLWRRVSKSLAPRTELVAVAYADHTEADCLPVEAVIVEARRFGLRKLLIDTWTKQGESSLEMLGLERLAQIAQLIRPREASSAGRSSSLWWALAGSIRLEDAKRLAAAGIIPECYGVRGDVCGGNRTAPLCSHQVQRWQRTLTSLNVGLSPVQPGHLGQS